MSEVLKLVRENIQKLTPYSSARHEFKGNADVFLDANENPFETGLNRYPDPLQNALKIKLSGIKKTDPSTLFLGNGSDEAIDLLIRVFCEPKEDHILIVPPTYGMYKVCADISDVDVRQVQLLTDFQLDVDGILKESNQHSKILFICSPNNPTGNLMAKEDLARLLQDFPGILVIDEAYIDFCPDSSMVSMLSEYPKLVVLQTLSKAWGMAAIRLGIAIASPEIITLLNAVKPPYNINKLTQQQALSFLDKENEMQDFVRRSVEQRAKLSLEMSGLNYVLKVYPSDANFLLVKMKDPSFIFHSLIDQGIVVRDRSRQPLCEGCLRITVGTDRENDFLIETLKSLQ
ncbi:MAG: histidinol-phosphate transaminase [Saprospiraceae bacterium]|nr:histidinol-phosphate transaminase [Saprospiraceae bacterium]